MTKLITALFGITLVFYVADAISIGVGKGGSFPAVGLGSMSLGAALALLLVEIGDRRR
jgi:hypothetical protein